MSLIYSLDNMLITAIHAAGLIGAVVLRRRLGPAFPLALLGFGLVFLFEIARLVTLTWPHSIQLELMAERLSFDEMMLLLGWLNVADAVVTIVSITLLAAAILTGRRPEPVP